MHHDALFFDKLFLRILLVILFTNFFYKKLILNGHFEGNAYGESKKNLKFQKKFEIGP